MELMEHGLGLPVVKRISDALAKMAALEKHLMKRLLFRRLLAPLNPWS
ncbi:MAG: hypothetical protein ACI8SR_000800 [Oceanicoccus sp.]|jgi:hypothetical protein